MHGLNNRLLPAPLVALWVGRSRPLQTWLCGSCGLLTQAGAVADDSGAFIPEKPARLDPRDAMVLVVVRLRE
jgi:hypothetical protein